MKPRIPYNEPSITELKVRYTTEVPGNGWDAHNGWADHCADDMRSPA
jgi:hypothetical protein